jgi:ATP-binding cassette, subfamily B, bacterial
MRSAPRTTSTPESSKTPVDEGQEWRGVAADGRDDLTEATTAKLAGRSRRLLGDLLRPHRRVIRLLIVAVLI